ncbi:MAG: VIT family protein [Candidatus Saccharibacteria bacterium]
MKKHKLAKVRFRPYVINTNEKSNWLRAAALGSNDGIISIAGLVIGVAGATQSKTAILTAGIAGIIAGAISLGAGEYVSVSTQRDMEQALLAREKVDLKNHPKEEFDDLVSAYEQDGLEPKIAKIVAAELTKVNAFATHADVDLHIDPNNLTNPWSSVFASSTSFAIGALIPLVVIMLSVDKYTIPVTFISVVIALTITGIISAKVSGANILKSTIRVVTGGALAMIITYAIGSLFNVVV